MVAPHTALLGLALALQVLATPCAAQSTPAGDPVQETLEDYDAGRYRRVASRGPALLATRPIEGRLPLAVANSLAWTGQYGAAAAIYQRLIGTPQEPAGRIGLGNILRWRGMPDKAAEQYAAARLASPDNPDIAIVETQLERDLRPATTLRYLNTHDSDGQRRNELVPSYRYWTAGNQARIDVSGVASQDRRGGITDDYREIRAGVFVPGLPLSPRLELGAANGARSSAVGFLHLEPIRDVIAIRAGRVNWGRYAFNSLSLRDGLMANNYGATLNTELPGGRLRARYDVFAISDGNNITDADLQLTPNWQPVPFGITWHIGGAYRKADRPDPRYWSPDSAYGIATVALRRNWYWDQGEFGVGVQRGFHVTDTARNTWGYNLNGRWWVRKDWSVGADASTSETPRPGVYRYTTVGLTIQKIW